jgi:exodeoxyribonuclease VII large subunit
VLRAAGHALELAGSRLAARLAYDGLARPLARLRERGQLVDERQQTLRLVFAERFRQARERLSKAEVATLRFGSGAQFARLSQRLGQRMFQLQQGVERLLLSGERRVNAEAARLQAALPAGRLARWDERVAQSKQRLGAALRHKLVQQRGLLRARVEAVAACDPERVLQRGYSITREARNRRVIRTVGQVKDGLRIITQLADGEFPATADDPRQAGLFDQEHA